MEEAQLLVRLHNIHAFLQLFKHDMYLIQNKAFCKYEETWKPNESQIVDATRKGFKFLSHETPTRNAFKLALSQLNDRGELTIPRKKHISSC